MRGVSSLQSLSGRLSITAQGHILSQSPTDATRFWWNLYGSWLNKLSNCPWVISRVADAGRVLSAVALREPLHPFVFFTLVTGPRRSLSLKLRDTRVYEPQIRARLGTTAHSCEVVVSSLQSLAGRLSSTAQACALPAPPWSQPRGKWMVSLVNSHTNATRIGWHLWEIDLRFAPGLPPGWS